MARAPAKIVPLMDVSGSMSEYGYLTPAKADLDTFVTMFQPGDRFAIVSFSDNATLTYPTSATLTAYDPTTSREASNRIQALSRGSLTNIGDAILLGTGLLKSQAEPRGMVLLSDGQFNEGPDPLTVLPKDIRIYTIALGNNGQLELLRKIARETQGQYLFAPDAMGLSSIYFDMLEHTKVGQVVTNACWKMQNAQRRSTVVRLSAGLDSASVAVNWADPSITFAQKDPGQNQVTVRILDPDFRPVELTPTDRNYGFIVYTLPKPKAGDWYFDVSYFGSKQCNVSACAIDPDMLTELKLEGPADVVAAGEPFTVRARLTHDGQPIGRRALAATADVPSVSDAEALARHGRELASMRLPEDSPKGSARSDELFRLQLLRQRKLPHVDILPRHELPGAIRELDDGEHELTFSTDKPGEYVIRVEAAAPHPRGGEFMRTRLLTVSVR
jgi:hypothetical protein